MGRLRRTPAKTTLMLALFGSVVPLACVSSQTVRLRCVPEQVSIYVDGELLEAGVDEVVLRTDEPHKIFVKAPGYQPKLVVLEPETAADGRPHLGPDEVCIEPVAIGVDRKLEIEGERDVLE
ncbi:MAG: hypothetical protein AAF430_06495 [Myxococcota bacterium]